MVKCPLSGACYLPEYKGQICRVTEVSFSACKSACVFLLYWGEVTAQSVWSRYDHHFLGMTRYNMLS